MSTSLISCPGCGAPVTIPFQATSAPCRHCGAVAALDTRLNAARLALTSQNAVETEARAALRLEIVRLCRVLAVERALMLGAVVCLPVLAIAIASTYAPEAVAPYELALALVSFSLGGVGMVTAGATWLYSRRRAQIERAAERRLQALMRAEQGATTTAGCPSCGAPLRFDGSDPCPLCPYCRAQLWVAYGRLIQWSEDASQRAVRWADVARATYFRVELPGARFWGLGVAAIIVVHGFFGGAAKLLEAFLEWL